MPNLYARRLLAEMLADMDALPAGPFMVKYGMQHGGEIAKRIAALRNAIRA